MERIYTIKLENGASYQVRAAEELNLAVHDQCVVRKDFYYDFGTIARIGAALEPGKGLEMPVVQRKADANDLSNAAANQGRCRGAMRSAQQMVEHLGLPMKLLNAHYSLDSKLLTIQFTADGRVDFRELVKELSRALNTRIELRQIGVRDESAIHGGISVCGQVLCCCRFLKEFNSINVRMAKDQDLSLTPATISGVCGRLKCCLKFEHEGYLELEKTMPRRGDWCECAAGRGRVSDRNLLTQEVTLCLEGGNLVRCKREEIQILPQDKARQHPRKNNDRKPPAAAAPEQDPCRNNRDRNQRPGNAPGKRDPRPPKQEKAQQQPPQQQPKAATDDSPSPTAE